ncbi:MAG TPA: GNAT family N-acetyltransferase [bacterium]
MPDLAMQRPASHAQPAPLVRDATEADIAAVQRIYAPHVLKGLASFEEEPPDVPEMVRRFRDFTSRGYPYIVAMLDGRVVGYAYVSPYRARRAYRFSVENSVYVEEGLVGRGVGRVLLAELIHRCEAGPWRQMVAIIGDSGNLASIKLHEAQGFQHVGTLRAVGFKLGRWVDTVIMERPLGAGATTHP